MYPAATVARSGRTFMPVRTPEEAAIMARVNEARHKDPAFPTRVRPETDERVY